MSLLDSLLLDPPRLDLWIAVRTDGVRGSGTESDPFNGSPRQEPAISVSSLTNSSDPSGREATVTTGTNHGYADGDVVTIAGATGAGAQYYNGAFVIYGAATNTFKYWMLVNPGGTATGAITCARTFFDEIIGNVAANTTIHLGLGIFQTKGFSQEAGGWQPKTGQKIVGSGMDVTILKIVCTKFVAPSGTIYLAIGTQIDGNIDGFEASDFTVDCNLGGQAIGKYSFAPVRCGAISVGGNHCRIRRVRAINFGTQTVGIECFVITVGWPSPTVGEVVDCVVEDCVVEKPSENNAAITSCIGIGAITFLWDAMHPQNPVQFYHRGCVIRNCVVNCYYAGGVSSQANAVQSITQINPPSGLQYEIETYLPHHRALANNVMMNNVYVIPPGGGNSVLSNVFNGSFAIDQIVSSTRLRFTLLSAPDGTLTSPIGAISI